MPNHWLQPVTPTCKPHGNLSVLPSTQERVFLTSSGSKASSQNHHSKFLPGKGTSTVWKSYLFPFCPSRNLQLPQDHRERETEYSTRPSEILPDVRGWLRQVSQSIRFPALAVDVAKGCPHLKMHRYHTDETFSFSQYHYEGDSGKYPSRLYFSGFCRQ